MEFLQELFAKQSYDPQNFFLIAGPCVVENEELVMGVAEDVYSICKKLGIPYIFKASYRKANRTSAASFTGIGDEAAMQLLKKTGAAFRLPTTSDIHAHEGAAVAAQYIDVLQIPAFLCRQTDLLQAAAATGKIVNVKKGQFLAPWGMANVVGKITAGGNPNVLVTERGASFGYNTLVSDMRALPIMARTTGAPVIFDATHSVQQPGGKGASSGGEREFVSVLARAAVAVGVAGVFIETHPDPDSAPSDGPNMVPLSEFKALLRTLMAFDALAKESIKDVAKSATR